MDSKMVDGLLLLLLHNRYDLNLVPNFFEIESELLTSLDGRVYFTRNLLDTFYDSPDYICFLDYCIQNLFLVVCGGDWKDNKDLCDIKNLLFSKFHKRFVGVRSTVQKIRFSHLVDLYVDVSQRTDPENDNFKLGYFPELTSWIRESVDEIYSSSGGNSKILLKELDFLKNKVDQNLKKHNIRIQYSDLLLNLFLKEKELDLGLIGDLSVIFPEQSGRFVRLFKVSVMPKIRKKIKLWIRNCMNVDREEVSCKSIGPTVLHSNCCKDVLEILFEPLKKIEEIEKTLNSNNFMRRIFMEEVFNPQVKKFVKYLKESISKRYKELYLQKCVRVGREQEMIDNNNNIKNKEEEKREEGDRFKIIIHEPTVNLNNLEELYQQLRGILSPNHNSEDSTILEYVKKQRNKICFFVAKKFLFKHRTKELLRDGFTNLNDLFCRDLNRRFCALSGLIYHKIFFLVIKHLVKLVMNEIIDIVLSSKERDIESFRVKVKTHRFLVRKLERLFHCKGKGIEMEYIRKYSSQLDLVFDMIEQDGKYSIDDEIGEI